MTEQEVKPKKNRYRLKLLFLFMAIFSISYQIGSMFEVDQGEAEQLVKDFEEATKGIDGIGIFLHNLQINTMMFIPAFGLFWGLLASFQTGYAFSAFQSVEPLLKDFPALAILYLSPFGLMELFGYSIGMSRSFIITKKLIKRDESLKKDWKPISIEFGIVVGLLLTAGIMEFYMIEWVAEMGGLSFFG